MEDTILKHITTVEVDAFTTFDAAAFFTEESQPDGIPFRLGFNFPEKLFSKSSVLLNIPGATLNVYDMRQSSKDDIILESLGGADFVKTSLAYIAQLIQKQPKGQKDVLLTDRWPNVFYIENDNGELWKLSCLWDHNW